MAPVRQSIQRSLSGAAAAGSKQLRMYQLEEWLVPDTRTKHLPLAAPLLTLAWWVVYSFMAGRYPEYAAAARLQPSDATEGWGPASMAPWLVFWGAGLPVFDGVYLYAWGARYAPALAAGQGWRLVTSVMMHSGPAHLVSNTLLWLLLSLSLERTYGALRVGTIFLLSALGGSFLSLAAEAPCVLYVGASGGIFGFLGLYAADLALNFQTLVAPLLRLLLLVVGVAAQLALEFATQRPSAGGQGRTTSHLSHLGGFMAGAALSFLFLPRLQDRRWRRVRKLAGRLGLTLPGEAPPASPSAAASGAGDVAAAGSTVAAAGPNGPQNRLSSAAGDVAVSWNDVPTGLIDVCVTSPPVGPQQAQQQGRAAPLQRSSCWSQRLGLYWLVCGVCGVVALVFLAVLPAYAYTSRLPQLNCPVIPAVGQP